MMLSIFENVDALPPTKEDKQKAAAKARDPKIVDINTEDDLLDTVTKYCWSPFIFEGSRKQDNFIRTDWMVLDIDDGMTIREAETKIHLMDVCALVVPTVSHTEENHRFRIIFPLARSIYKEEEYRQTWEYLSKQFPSLDPHASDLARLYFASTTVDGFWNEGSKLLEPIFVQSKKDMLREMMAQIPQQVEVSEDIKETVKNIYGKEPEKVSKVVYHFLKNAHTGLDGQWICSLNAFCYTLSLQNIQDSVIWDVVEKIAPMPLDKRDRQTIERAIKDGTEQRRENG